MHRQPNHVNPGSLFFTFPWESDGGGRKKTTQYGSLLAGSQCRQKRKTLQKLLGVQIAAKTWKRISQNLLASSSRCFSCPSEVAATLPRIVELLQEEDPKNQDLLNNLLSVLFLDLEQMVIHGTPAVDPVVDAATMRVMKQIEEIRTRPAEVYTLSSMALECCLGRSRFSDLMKTITGDSPIQFVNRLRIEKACELLEKSERSISDIAFDQAMRVVNILPESLKVFCTVLQQNIGKDCSVPRSFFLSHREPAGRV